MSDNEWADRVRSLRRCRLHWVTDPDQRGWLRAEHDGNWLRIRLNPQFPRGPLYALWVTPQDYVTFDDLPATWTRGPLRWPETAAPLAYDERFDYDDLGEA